MLSMSSKMLLLASLLAVVARADYVAVSLYGDEQCTGNVLRYSTTTSPIYFMDFFNGSLDLETMPHTFGVCTNAPSSTRTVFSYTSCFDGATVLVSLFSDRACTLALPNTIPTKYTTSSCGLYHEVNVRATCIKGAMPFPAIVEFSAITANIWELSESCTGVPSRLIMIPMTFGGVCVNNFFNGSDTALCSPDGHLLSWIRFYCHGCACEGNPFDIGSGCNYFGPNDITVECHSRQLEPGRATDDTPSASSQAALPLALFGLILCAALGYVLYKKRRAMQPAQENVHLASASEIASNVDDSAVLNPDAEPVTMPIPDKEAGPAAAGGQ